MTRSSDDFDFGLLLKALPCGRRTHLFMNLYEQRVRGKWPIVPIEFIKQRSIFPRLSILVHR
jgi:hypothetical protein